MYTKKCSVNLLFAAFSGLDLHFALDARKTLSDSKQVCLCVWMTYAFSRLASRDVFCTNRLDARLKSSSAHSCETE